MDDWQLTISDDGRLTPIVPARGNHEASNQTLVDVFDLPFPNAWYAFNIGGDLLRVYTLNSMMPAGAEQRQWLEADLRANAAVRWKIAQYHHPMRPHTSRKVNKNDLAVHWAPLFERYGVDIAIECDAHVAKVTWPIRLARGNEGDDGFVRDDLNGTVYLGEGGWGAPLRDADRPRSWTRALGSFNQFKWIFVDKNRIEVRFVLTDGAANVASVSPHDIFLPPPGLSLWSPPTGQVIVLERFRTPVTPPDDELFAARAVIQQAPQPQQGQAFKPSLQNETENWEESPMLMADPMTGEVKVKFTVVEPCDVVIRIIDTDKRVVHSQELPRQRPGEYLRSLYVERVSPGRYLILIRDQTHDRLLRRFRLLKR
ncbi:MAG: hypothetical protein KatS3mg029_0001 [Saprospiraceae bacterium]|nr:MAG: hypothetical protein KatS3mg029_0001 [Saprospiraceae bacterium]